MSLPVIATLPYLSFDTKDDAMQLLQMNWTIVPERSNLSQFPICFLQHRFFDIGEIFG